MARRVSIRALLANERTFLAWLRTAIALMAFGFVVDKFDLFVRLRVSPHDKPHGAPTWAGLGIALVFVALVTVLAAAARYARIRADILAGRAQTAGDLRAPLISAGLLVVAALVLIVYLWATTQPP